MSEYEFWRCTPKKLFAIWDLYKESKGIKDEKEETGYIDELNI